ncbi:MAG: hypothetical protein ACTIJ9_17225 [Aequorivita sp.]
MRQKYLLFSLFFAQSICLVAQVGINNINPSASLDVTGNVLVQEKLILEDSRNYTGETSSKLLMIHNDGSIIHYNIGSSSYGPLNFVQYVFKNTSNYGLTDGYNTRIDASKYTLAVHGYYFVRSSDGNGNVSFRSINGAQNVQGQQFYAYVQGGTWRIKALVNNSRFYIGYVLANVDIYMDVLIYRNNFITKVETTPRVINMGRQTTRTAPLPAGF